MTNGATAAEFSPAARQLFEAKAISEGVAWGLGVRERGNALLYPTGKQRSLNGGSRKHRNPPGRRNEPWTLIASDPGAPVILCEGETCSLAAASALGTMPPIGDADPGVVCVPGVTCRIDGIVAAVDGAGDVYIGMDNDSKGNGAALKFAEGLKEAGHDSLRVQYGAGEDMSSTLAAAKAGIRGQVLADLLLSASTIDEGAIEGAQEIASDEEAPELEPLPNDAVTRLLAQVTETLDRYVVLPGEHERDVLALFAAHTWAIDGAHATPYMLVVSPEKRSGKSRLLQVLELVVARPWGVIGASEAAMFRKIAKDKPTLQLDEIDAIFNSHSERTEPLRAILNAGNRPGATVARCVGENKDVEDFPIFCAKVLAGIDSGHRIPDTVRDRAVTISMQRKTGAEPVERFRYRDANAGAQPIREGFERWAVGAVDQLLAADPELPRELDDRAAEAWEPLLAIADMAGRGWPERARSAAKALSGDIDRDETTTGTMLLAAIQKAFGESDRITTIDLLGTINADDELPFGGWRDGKGLDGRRLARHLKPYGIRPRTIRIGDHTEKGYLKESLTEAWERWLPTCTEPSQPSQASGAVTQAPHDQADVTDVTAVTDKSPGNGTVTANATEEAELERIAAKVGAIA